VIEADSGNTAELLWVGQAMKVDLALIDVNLPGITAPELVERFRQTRPDLQVVYLATPAPEGQASASVSLKNLLLWQGQVSVLCASWIFPGL